MPSSLPRFFNYCLLLLFVAGCTDNHEKRDALKQHFHAADSLVLAGRPDLALKLLDKLRPGIKHNDPLLTIYYTLKARHNRNEPEVMKRYADSALAFFSDTERTAKYPDIYYEALVINGDAGLAIKRYDHALDYYYRARKLTLQRCDDGYLSGNIGGIYYDQRNYHVAARYMAEAYRKLQTCRDKLSKQRYFFMAQGALNNTALAYDKAGMIDSAMFYYDADARLIEEYDRNNVVEKRYLNGARTVLFDNLGGLHLKNKKLQEAEKYLLKSTSINNGNVDGIMIPPFLKLADLYMRTNRLSEAKPAFDTTRSLLDKFPEPNLEGDIQWHKLYSDYQFRLGNAKQAYQLQSKYLTLRDQYEASLSDIYRVNVELELNALQQQQALAELQHRDKLKEIYIIAISLVVAMAIVIIMLIYRNLQRSRGNQQKITLHNTQLQQTLTELEKANKNYIRVMRVMAHDLRNPLAGMTGLAAMLLEEKEFSEDNKHMLRLIESTGNNSIAMINELLQSGLADEQKAMVTKPLDMKALLAASVELLQFKANEKHQQIKFTSDEQPVIAEVNHEKIWRVFNNIIVNAIKFSHAHGVINVGLTADNNKRTVLVTIADEGIGIPQENCDSIFDMFTPAKRTGTSGEQPFGLGLSISKRIVDMHHGRIWFKSEPGKGTTFFIELPMEQEQYAS